ncbi:MAG TPA: HAD-IIIC family phosphatase, partial [Stellaceae bacterium]|nr:HAD-IIIC family phosphatase [Stellaceae bacterium]
LKAGRGLDRNDQARPELRVSLLADHATQQLALVLKAAIDEVGFFPLVHEAEYATQAQEIYDTDSALHRHKPDFVIYSLALQKYRDRFLGAASVEARETLPRDYMAQTLSAVDALAKAGYEVILSNLALPLERGFGSYGALTHNSLYGSVLTFNQLLAEAVASRRQVHLNDVMYLSCRVGLENFLDERLWFGSKYLCANRFLPDLARSMARAMAVRKGRVSKCIVLDLDNTVWGGVIGDDGKEGIALGGDAYGEAFQHFQRYILSLRDRGYILAVCSKNNEDVALDAFRTHPEMILREEDISVFAVNWNDKASNIEFIARVLNIGLDSLVFVDDSPFERNLVRTALPQVAVPEMPEDVADYVWALERSGLFEAAGEAADDRSRNQKYREEALRTTEQIKYGNIDDYLRSLAMVIEVKPFTPKELPRIAQLISRSNQFNLRTQRFSEAQCEGMMRAPQRHVTVAARLGDRFGDYGLISVICCDIRDEVLEVSELVMSCRVLKRGVERHLMNHLFRECRRLGFKGVRGEYIASAKNAMVKDFYKDFGFECLERSEARDIWYLATERYAPRLTFIEESRT